MRYIIGYSKDTYIRLFTSIVKGATIGHCLRVYNRNLTEDEILYNYEIDRVRYLK